MSQELTEATPRCGVVGFIGLGNMGRPMAANIAKAGFELVCFDVAGTAERTPLGARAAESAEAVFAACDTLLLSLPDGAATLSVVDALIDTDPSRGTVRTVIDLSTVGSAVAQDAASRLAAVGVTYVDGPVSGGVAGARSATVALMFGGPASVFEAQRPLLSAFAGHVCHVGAKAGMGQAMKLLNNFLSATALAASSEALAFGQASGLDLQVMLDVLNASTGRNSATVDKFPSRVLTGRYDAGFSTALMTKDVQLYLDEIGRAGTPSNVGAAVVDVWNHAHAAMPGSDFTEIWKFVSGQSSP